MNTTLKALPPLMYEKLTGWADASPHATQPRVLLKHGLANAEGIVAPAQYRGPSGECFYNSMRGLAQLSAIRSEVYYCEGYAYQTGFEVLFEHAWLLVDGRVWETTWPTADGVTYLGMAFTLGDVSSLLATSEETPLFGDWDRNFQVLRACGKCCSKASAAEPWGTR